MELIAQFVPEFQEQTPAGSSLHFALDIRRELILPCVYRVLTSIVQADGIAEELRIPFPTGRATWRDFRLHFPFVEQAGLSIDNSS